MFAWLEHWSEHLLWFNVAVALVAKLALPWGSDGLAAITAPIDPPDTGVLLAATNAQRTALKLVPLERSAALDAAAREKLSDMARRGYFAHVTPDGKQPWDFVTAAGYTYRAAGENLAKGFADMAAVVPAWMGSPGHKANIVNPGYRHVGFAASRVMYQGKPTTLVVQMFGTPLPPRVAPPKLQPLPAKATPSKVMAPSSAAVATVSATLDGWLAIWLSALLALLTVALAVRGGRRPLVIAWAGNAALLAVVTLVPALAPAQGLIF